MDNIFEYRDWLDNHSKEDGLYRYYEQKYNARKNLLNVFWTPFFEEIKRKTEGIQKTLKNLWYENIEWLLKSLIIDWIKFFLHLDYQIRIDDDIIYDDYLLWLFDSLKINTNNKKLLNDILSELESWWGEIPKNPLNILVTHQFNKKNKSENKTETNFINNKLELAQKINPNYLQPILNAFWNKKEVFIQNLRAVWVPEERLEYAFLIWLLWDITKILNGNDIGEHQIIFERYNIDTSNKNRLTSLKEAIEHHLYKISNENSNKYNSEEEKRIDEPRNAQNRLSWKKILHWHCVFDDSPENLKEFGENVVIYNIWDEYIPSDNSCVNRLEFINKIYNCNISELKKMYKNKLNDTSDRIGNDQKHIIFLQRILILSDHIDLIKMYKDWERFEVIKGTYNDKEAYDHKYLSCRFVNIRSLQTWEEYRALSK